MSDSCAYPLSTVVIPDFVDTEQPINSPGIKRKTTVIRKVDCILITFLLIPVSNWSQALIIS